MANEFLASFNRYFLRYGPSVSATLLISGYWIYEAKGFTYLETLGKSFSYHPFLLLLLLGVAIGITYVFTWPVLLLHAYRFLDCEILKTLSERRGEAAFNAKDIAKDAGKMEFVTTVRHLREYGNSLMCFGSTVLHMILLPIFWHRCHFLFFYVVIAVPVLFGAFVWVRAMNLESLQRDI